MISLGFDRVDEFVSKLQKKGIDVRWDGWTMVFFKADRKALRSAKGRRRNGAMGFETRVQPNNKGVWMVDSRLTRNKVAAQRN